MSRKRKVVKLRGSKTHGHGAKKKRRGAGNRGGRGKAGSGKRADQKKPSFWKDKTKKLAKTKSKALKKKKKRKIRIINLGQLPILAKAINSTTINLKQLGFNKLLGSGSINQAFNITVDSASSKAIEKIKAAGGEINVLDKNLAEKLYTKPVNNKKQNN